MEEAGFKVFEELPNCWPEVSCLVAAHTFVRLLVSPGWLPFSSWASPRAPQPRQCNPCHVPLRWSLALWSLWLLMSSPLPGQDWQPLPGLSTFTATGVIPAVILPGHLTQDAGWVCSMGSRTQNSSSPRAHCCSELQHHCSLVFNWCKRDYAHIKIRVSFAPKCK